MARYRVSGNFRAYKSIVVRNRDDEAFTVTYEIADLCDTRNLHIYSEGAHRVNVTGPGPVPRAKTFHGECAWMDAERLFGDYVTKIQFSRDGFGGVR